MSQESDRNLLFGVLALQMDFISREQLVAATATWVQDKARSLAEILLHQAFIDRSIFELLQALVTKHLERHDDDVRQSLEALSAPGFVRQDLEAIDDADLTQSVARISTGAGTSHEQSTCGWSTGERTSENQRFHVLRPHARGGLGQVYVALDTELNREVALKEILPQHADNLDSRARFTREAEITGRLEHPGIVPVFGLGQYADGRPYYAMRFIHGKSFKDAIKQFHDAGQRRDAGQRSLEFRQLLGRFVDICQTVEYAHSRGVLHRDVKPGNVMLGRYGETLVVDWGLAKAIGRDSPLSEHHSEPTLRPQLSGSNSANTMTGELVGTAAYMSPEQAQGRLQELGPASDVYSLGATLYVLLTGQAPLHGKVNAILKAVLAGNFPRPRAVAPTVPRPLEQICLKAMATRPADRYASPAELADDIERWLADEPVSAYREPWAEMLRRWTRRHRAAVLAGMAMLLFAIVALVLGNVLVRNERDIARRERDRARQNAAAVRQTIEHILIDLGDDSWSQIPQFESQRVEMVQRAVVLYRRLLHQQPEDAMLRCDAAVAFRRAANLYRMVNRAEAARKLYEESITIMRQLVAEQSDEELYRLRLLDLLCDIGDFTFQIEGPAAAEPVFREAFEVGRKIWEQPQPSDSARRAEARVTVDYADLLRASGRYREAVPLAETAGRMWGELATSRPSESTLQAVHVLAWTIAAATMREAGELERAEDAAERAVRYGQRAATEHAGNPNTQFTLGVALYEQGRLREARGFAAGQARTPLDQSVDLFDSLVEAYPQTASFGRRLAEALTARSTLRLAQEEVSGAVEDARRAVDVLEQLDESSGSAAVYQPLLAKAYLALGQALIRDGDRAAALSALSRARRHLQQARACSPDHPGLAVISGDIETSLIQLDE